MVNTSLLIPLPVTSESPFSSRRGPGNHPASFATHQPVAATHARIRGLREKTQRGCVWFVRSFAAFVRRPPDTATPENIRRFQVHQAESGVPPRKDPGRTIAWPEFLAESSSNQGI
jgi:hypothetical protein